MSSKYPLLPRSMAAASQYLSASKSKYCQLAAEADAVVASVSRSAVMRASDRRAMEFMSASFAVAARGDNPPKGGPDHPSSRLAALPQPVLARRTPRSPDGDC